MKTFMEAFKDRYSEISESTDSESGMEAAQVILILFLVVIGLIPVIIFIRNKIASKGSDAGNTINNIT